MELAIKLAQALVPIIVDLIKQHHSDKSSEEQQQITESLFSHEINKAHNP